MSPSHTTNPAPVLDDTWVSTDWWHGWRGLLVLPEDCNLLSETNFRFHYGEPCGVLLMQNVAPDLLDRYDDADDLLDAWQPTPPEGAVIAAKWDTEDGPVAFYLPETTPRLSRVLPRRAATLPDRPHVTVNLRHQSDRHPTAPEGRVLLSDRQPLALPAVLLYALLHHAANVHGDRQFADDLLFALVAQHGVDAVHDALGSLIPAIRDLHASDPERYPAWVATGRHFQAEVDRAAVDIAARRADERRSSESTP